MSDRTLTDADVKAIVEGLYARAKSDFYADLGKGVWAFIWKCAVVSMIGMAAYGGLKGIK
jgi:hypothetical protein